MATTEYTWQDIAKHMESSGLDNWLVIDGIVYDVTDWVKEHPGGKQPLINWSANDASKRFRIVHKLPEKWLKEIAPRYRIGILKEIIYTMEDVTAHTDKDGNDNWLVIDEYVYDVTKWMKDHPGGTVPLVNWSGKDASERFKKVHKDPIATMKKFGPKYRIGKLATQQMSKL
eukprot:g9628.t1